MADVAYPMYSLEAAWLGPQVTDSAREEMVVDDIRVCHLKSYENSQDKGITLSWEALKDFMEDSPPVRSRVGHPVTE